LTGGNHDKIEETYQTFSAVTEENNEKPH